MSAAVAGPAGRSRGRPLPAGEGRRKLVHASMGLFALALPWLSWPAAAGCAIGAFLFNLLVLPRLLGHRLACERAGASERGVLVYPVVVLTLILVFREALAMAAFGWGVLAFGDAAAGVVGQKWGRSRLPWNPDKTWEGVGAFALAGLAGGALLFGWTVALAGQLTIPAGALGHVASIAAAIAGVAAPAIVLAAALESVPHGLDDNVLPAFVVPVAIAAVVVGPAFPVAPGEWRTAVAVNAACALLALVTRLLRPGGVAVAWAIGVATWVAAGPRGFLLLLAFLVAGLAVTFVGYSRKRAAGTAERSGGRRGAGEVLAKGSVVLALALTAVVSAGTPALPWWLLAAVLAAAAADTWGTEIGVLLGRHPFTLTGLRRVPAGTPGAVSWPGLAASLAGSAMIAAVAVLLAGSPIAWSEAAAITLAGFLAATTESLLPALGPASHAGKNLALTLLGPLFAFVLLGVLP